MSNKLSTHKDIWGFDRDEPAREHWRWYHGALFYLAIQIMTFSLAGLVSTLRGERIKKPRDLFGDTGYFQSLHQAKFTPPSWAFAPAWTLNNFCAIYGLLRVLNKPQASQGRSEYLALQGVSWINFVIFNAAYFSLRSPLNALALTLSMLALTIVSSLIALLRLKDTWVALSLATLFLWLIVASSAALFQAAWNKDEFYQAGPFLHPVPALEK